LDSGDGLKVCAASSVFEVCLGRLLAPADTAVGAEDAGGASVAFVSLHSPMGLRRCSRTEGESSTTEPKVKEKKLAKKATRGLRSVTLRYLSVIA
jgi:hypothetical protein